MNALLSSLTPEQVVDAIDQLAADVSHFAPAPVSTVAGAIAAAGPLVEVLLRSGAADASVTADALEKALEIAMKAASDAQMSAELK